LINCFKELAGVSLKLMMYLSTLPLIFFWIFVPGLTWADTPPLLDTRISVSHASGLYPKWGEDYLVRGATTAENLGFQAIEIYMNPQICWTPHNHNLSDPNGGGRLKLGIYQTRDWCSDKERELNMTQLDRNIRSLTDLAAHPRYQEVFSKPFSTFIIDVDPVDFGQTEYAACSIRPGAWDITLLDWSVASNWNLSGPTFTPGQLQRTYKEFYDLTKYLLYKYRETEKTFILQTVNEMDWAILPFDKNGFPDATKAPLPDRVQNAILYWNTVQDAIDQARNESALYSGVGVYQGCEINHVSKVIKGGKAAVSEIVPNTRCDLYGYSAYDTGFGPKADFANALNYIESKANASGRRSVAPFSSKRVYISELGWNEISGGTPKLNQMLINVQRALDWGVPIVNLWTLFDNECDQMYPKLSQCRSGYWMVKPNDREQTELGELSTQYNRVLKNYKSTLPRKAKPTKRNTSSATRNAIYHLLLGK